MPPPAIRERRRGVSNVIMDTKSPMSSLELENSPPCEVQEAEHKYVNIVDQWIGVLVSNRKRTQQATDDRVEAYRAIPALLESLLNQKNYSALETIYKSVNFVNHLEQLISVALEDISHRPMKSSL
jgi:hypothetical protein